MDAISAAKSSTAALATLTLATIAIVFCGALYFFANSSSEQQASASQSTSVALNETAIVEFVVDGDTVDIRIGATEERVRLIGIDTPETVNRDTPIQCFGAEATAALRELLPEGSQLRIERDVEARDRFGRLLLYLYRADDELFVNRWMVDNGYAAATSYEPNVAFEAAFSEAEAEARRNNVGLWSSCDGPDQPLE